MPSKHTGVFLYAVVDPVGAVLWNTLKSSKESAWVNGGFEHASTVFSLEWRERYWLRHGAALVAAMRKGYSFKKYELHEIDELP